MKSVLPSPPPFPPHAPPARRTPALGRLNEEQLAAALKQHWRLIKTVLKEQYLALTDEDLHYVEGDELQLLEHLEKKTGRDRNEFFRLILICGSTDPR